MSNAVSHEIKTPLSRMQFEIELAQQAQSVYARPDVEMRAQLSGDTDAIAGKPQQGVAVDLSKLEKRGSGPQARLESRLPKRTRIARRCEFCVMPRSGNTTTGNNAFYIERRRAVRRETAL
jgi:signal transduction histidine kinase